MQTFKTLVTSFREMLSLLYLQTKKFVWKGTISTHDINLCLFCVWEFQGWCEFSAIRTTTKTLNQTSPSSSKILSKIDCMLLCSCHQKLGWKWKLFLFHMRCSFPSFCEYSIHSCTFSHDQSLEVLDFNNTTPKTWNKLNTKKQIF